MKNNEQTPEEPSEFIFGRHPAINALKSDQEINKVFIPGRLRKRGLIGEIIKLAKKRSLVIQVVPKSKLERQHLTRTARGRTGSLSLQIRDH